MAKCSAATRQRRPRTRHGCARRRRLASAAPPYRSSSPLRSRAGSVLPRATTRPPTIGMMSVVVLPTSMKSASGNSRDTTRGARHPVGGRDAKRLAPRDGGGPERAIGAVDPRLDIRKRRLERVEHRRDAFPLGRETIRQLRRHRDRHRRRRAERVRRLGSTDGSRCGSRQSGSGRSNDQRLGLPLVDPGRLDVGAADVPADDRAHHAEHDPARCA